VKQDAQDVTLTSITTYNHQHAKLLLSSLALSVSGLLHDRNSSQAVDTEYVTAASQLFIHCFNIVIDTLAKSATLGKYQLMSFLLLITRPVPEFSSGRNPAIFTNSTKVLLQPHFGQISDLCRIYKKIQF